MATIQQVNAIKASMSKKASSVDSLSDEDVESFKDMLQRLNNMDITLEVLAQTLIGTVISKFKAHDELGPIAKGLVKKWKKVAKSDAGGGSLIARSSSVGSVSSTTSSNKAGIASNSAAVLSAVASDNTSGKAERRDSTSSAILEMQEEWSTLQPHRKTTCQKLHDFLKLSKQSLVKQGINGNAVDHLVVERATDIESAIQNKYEYNKSEYLNKARSLCFNIKKNTTLAHQIILGQIPAQDLVSMTSDQLASEEKKKEMEERTKKMMDSKQLDWAAQNEDKINEMCGIKGELLQASLFTCGRCKSTKTTSTQKQTRSADEPMTVFVLCLNCGKRWKFS